MKFTTLKVLIFSCICMNFLFCRTLHKKREPYDAKCDTFKWCGSGLSCDDRVDSGRCRVSNGQPCKTDENCLSTSFCSFGKECLDGGNHSSGNIGKNYINAKCDDINKCSPGLVCEFNWKGPLTENICKLGIGNRCYDSSECSHKLACKISVNGKKYCEK